MAIIPPDENTHQGFVGVVDVLGFAKLLEESQSGQNKKDIYWALLKDMKSIALKNNAKPFAGQEGGLDITQMLWFVFNDMIIFLQPDASQKAAIHFFEFANALLYKALLLERPLFLRGGISYGEIKHDSTMYLGEPIAEAYGLEESSEWVGMALHETCKASEHFNAIIRGRYITQYEGTILKNPVPDKYEKQCRNSGYCCLFRQMLTKPDIDNILSILENARRTTDAGFQKKYVNTMNFLQGLPQ